MATRTIPCPRCGRKFGAPAHLAVHQRMTHDNPDWIPSVHRPGKERKAMGKPPICPVCSKAALISATKYGPRASCCGLHSWDYAPLVSPAVLAARNAAHKAFDALWQSGAFSRGEGYRRLQIAMSLSSEDCHISLMNEDQARRVVEIVAAGVLLEVAAKCT